MPKELVLRPIDHALSNLSRNGGLVVPFLILCESRSFYARASKSQTKSGGDIHNRAHVGRGSAETGSEVPHPNSWQWRVSFAAVVVLAVLIHRYPVVPDISRSIIFEDGPFQCVILPPNIPLLLIYQLIKLINNNDQTNQYIKSCILRNIIKPTSRIRNGSRMVRTIWCYGGRGCC